MDKDKKEIEKSIVQATLLIEGLVNASSQTQRLHVAKLAFAAFDNDLVELHNRMVSSGALLVFTRLLESALNDRDIKLITWLCKLVVLQFRCSDKIARTCLMTAACELYPLIIHVLFTSSDEDSESEVAFFEETTVQSSVKELVSRFSGLHLNMEQIKGSGTILRCFRSIFEEWDHGNIGGESLEAVSCIVELLSGLAADPRGQGVILCSPGFFESMTASLLHSCIIFKGLGRAVATLLHTLSVQTRNKFIMAKNRRFLILFMHLLTSSDPSTRSISMKILKHLAVEKSTRYQILNFGGFRLIKIVLKSLQEEETKASALKSLLPIISRESASRIAKRSETLELLTDLAGSIPATESSALAAQAIKRIASHVPVGSREKGALIASIIKVSSAQDHRIRQWGTRALYQQSQIQASAFYLIRLRDGIGMLAKLCMDADPTVKSTAIATVFNLASNPLNAKLLAQKRILLDVLSDSITNADEPVYEDARRQAVLAILCFIDHLNSTESLAKQFNVVVSLSRYGLSRDDDNGLRRAALHGVICLAPHM